MKYRWFIVGILCVILLLTGDRLWSARACDPVYKGKRLSEWIDQLDLSRPYPERLNAEKALQEAGSLAYPLVESLLRDRTGAMEAVAIRACEEKLGKKWPFRTAEKNHELAIHACHALGTNAVTLLPALLDCAVRGHPNGSSSIQPFVKNFGLASVVPLMERATNSDPRVRQRAALLLREVGVQSPEAAKTVIQLLNDPVQDVQAAAVFSAEDIAMKNSAAMIPAVGTLSGFLNNPDQTLQAAAVAGLKYLGREAAPAVPNLLLLLEDRKAVIRRAAVDALGMIAPGSQYETRTVERLLVVRNDPDADCRRDIHWGLGFFPDQAHMVLPILMDGLTSSDPIIVNGCLLGLSRLGRASQPAAPQLKQMATHDMFGSLARRALRELER